MPDHKPKGPQHSGVAVWTMGFRPFFLGAGVWAAASMFIWLGIYNFNWSFAMNDIPAIHWHAHEMVFGYCMAVIAGFLLTAVPNWTNSSPLAGIPLLTIFGFWCAARLTALLGGNSWFAVTVSLEMLFMTALFLAVAFPVIRCKQYRQSGIMAKLLLLTACNILFYLGVTGIVENGVQIGLYAAFYLIIALILTIARRVFPMFIENGLKLDTPLRNRSWIDISSIVLFLGFWILEVFMSEPSWSSLIALLLAVIHSVRLYDWYVPAIWRRPLLWVLYLSYISIVLAFLLKGVAWFDLRLSPLLLIHLFAIGGIGLVTCGMMARVSWGHTGRNIQRPSRWLSAIFTLVLAAAIVRVLFPLISAQNYANWLMISKILWIGGFTLFVVVYLPVMTGRRVDH